jgi:hypothetical protein
MRKAKTVKTIEVSKRSFAPAPFHRWDDGVLKRGSIVAVNVFGDESLLVRWDGQTGIAQEFAEKNTGKYLQLSETEQAEYVALCRAAADAAMAVNQYQWNHTIAIPQGTDPLVS